MKTTSIDHLLIAYIIFSNGCILILIGQYIKKTLYLAVDEIKMDLTSEENWSIS